MILQALVEFYESMAAAGNLSPFGWSQISVSYVLCLDSEGNLTNVIHTVSETEIKSGKKTKKEIKPILRLCPAQFSRSSGVQANFLCDHSGYILGIDNKGKPQRSKECFENCRELHRTILSESDSDTARAILNFFENWDVEKASAHPALSEYLEDILSGVNLTFTVNGLDVSRDQAITDAWNRYYGGKGENEGVCLVTGKYGTVEKIHPQIRGIPGAQSSGAALVSFNAPAFYSYGKEQNLNAPTGKYATFAYTTALNHLVKDGDRHMRIGDATVLFWMTGDNAAAEQMVQFAFDDDPPQNYTKAELHEKLKTLVDGQPVEFDGSRVDPNQNFYVLGISPNAARLSVRFFHRNTYGNFLKNILAHHERMNIERPSYDEYETVPVWKMINETVNPNSKDKTPSPNMAGDVLRAILNDSPYPATLLNAVNLRIRAERNVTRGKAAIIKAYYLKNQHKDVPKEVLTMSLNRESNNVPYCLGRLFALLEKLQTDANGASTVKDHYFVSAAATPASIFTILLRLSKSHLKKLSSEKPGYAIKYDQQITEIMNKFGESLPTRLTLAEQGSFQLGYYHQNNALYQKKEEQ